MGWKPRTKEELALIRTHTWKKGESGNPRGGSKKQREQSAAKRQIEALLGKKKYQRIELLNRNEIAVWFEHILSMSYEQATEVMNQAANKIPMIVRGYMLAIYDDMKGRKDGKDARTLDAILKFLYGDKHEVTGRDGTPLYQPKTINAAELKNIFNELDKDC